MDSSIEHLDIDKGTCLRRLGKKSQQGERLGKGEWVLSQTLEVLQRKYLTTGAQKLIIMGLVPARIWWHDAFGICPTQRNKQGSFDIFLEVTIRWDERGGDDKTLNKLRVDVMLGNKEVKRRVTWKKESGNCQEAQGVSKTTPQNLH